jgi:hypothetical protein
MASHLRDDANNKGVCLELARLMRRCGADHLAAILVRVVYGRVPGPGRGRRGRRASLPI